MFVIITLAAIINHIEILLHVEVEAVGYCQRCSIDVSSDHK